MRVQRDQGVQTVGMACLGSREVSGQDSVLNAMKTGSRVCGQGTGGRRKTRERGPWLGGAGEAASAHTWTVQPWGLRADWTWGVRERKSRMPPDMVNCTALSPVRMAHGI